MCGVSKHHQVCHIRATECNPAPPSLNRLPYPTPSSAATGFVIPEWLPTWDNLEFAAAVQQLDRVVYGMINRRRQELAAAFGSVAAAADAAAAAGGSGGGGGGGSAGVPSDLLTSLLLARDEDGSGMSDQALRDELMTLLVAGQVRRAAARGGGWREAGAGRQGLCDDMLQGIAGLRSTRGGGVCRCCVERRTLGGARRRPHAHLLTPTGPHSLIHCTAPPHHPPAPPRPPHHPLHCPLPSPPLPPLCPPLPEFVCMETRPCPPSPTDLPPPAPCPHAPSRRPAPSCWAGPVRCWRRTPRCRRRRRPRWRRCAAGPRRGHPRPPGVRRPRATSYLLM